MKSIRLFNIFCVSLLTIFSFSIKVNSSEVKIVCQTELTHEFIRKFSKAPQELCSTSSVLLKTDSKYFSLCTRAKHASMKIESCKILQKSGLIDWSHQQIINIPKFKGTMGAAYQYSMPCWTYGTPTEIQERVFVITDNLMTLRGRDSISFSNFYVNLENMKGGWGEPLDYNCVLSNANKNENLN